jgi:hypothetical protein
VYVPLAVNLIIVLDPLVVMVGLPVVVPLYLDVGTERITTPEPPLAKLPDDDPPAPPPKLVVPLVPLLVPEPAPPPPDPPLPPTPTLLTPPPPPP